MFLCGFFNNLRVYHENRGNDVITEAMLQGFAGNGK